jgi:isoleucyl-tRNA synthetase
VPAAGENRINGMIANRPDWVVSRQRAWGVPITVFVEKETGAILVDAKVNAAIAGAFELEGADAWFTDTDGARFLKPSATTRRCMSASPTCSTSGSIPARPMPSRWRSAPICAPAGVAMAAMTA